MGIVSVLKKELDCLCKHSDQRNKDSVLKEGELFAESFPNCGNLLQTVGEEAFYGLLQSTNVQIVDVRSASGYEVGHIKGAVNIPFEQNEESDELLSKIWYLINVALNRVGIDRPVAVYSNNGHRSEQAGIVLARAGFNVSNLFQGVGGGISSSSPITKKPYKICPNCGWRLFTAFRGNVFGDDDGYECLNCHYRALHGGTRCVGESSWIVTYEGDKDKQFPQVLNEEEKMAVFHQNRHRTEVIKSMDDDDSLRNPRVALDNQPDADFIHASGDYDLHRHTTIRYPGMTGDLMDVVTIYDK